MAEMLVMAIDKANPDDPRLDAQLHKRGHVVVIVEDGHPWSVEELTHERWAVMRVPGVKVADLSAYIALDPADAENEHVLPQLRAFRFDLDAHDGSPLTRERALALKKRVTPIADPDVFQ